MLLNRIKKLFIRLNLLFLFFLIQFYGNGNNIAYAFDTSSTNYLTGYYNQLINDDAFIDKNSMGADEVTAVNNIQQFLSDKGSYLATYKGGDERTAAKIIWDAAQGNTTDSRSNGWKPDGHPAFPDINQTTGTVNPKVILVLLQKEQSLITGKFKLDGQSDFTDTDGINYALLHAMGYACPDEGTWDPAMFGFSKQVDWGAWQLRFSYERAQGTGYLDFQVNQTKSFLDYYIPNCSDASCVAQNPHHDVLFTNKATPSLFRYTPYLFNGNYNFWKLYTGWFGDPTYTPPAPAPDAGPQPPTKAGDCARDGVVDSTDLSILADSWGKQVSVYTQGDLSGDGVVDSTDLSILADGWGK